MTGGLNGTSGRLIIRDLPKTNIAATASVKASSTLNAQSGADQSVDGVIGKSTGAWVSGGETNPWLQLSWPAPRTLNRIDLFDRISATNNVNSGRLVFSDGSSIDVTDIPPNGKGKAVSFDSKTVTWVKFEVTGGTGTNVGLSEIQVRDSNSEPAYRMFNADSFWWSQWNLNLLWGMAYPEILEEWVNASLQFYEDDPKHRIPWGSVAGDHSWIMSGAQRTPLIARGIQMDLKNVDLIKAYDALVKSHTGAPFRNPAGHFGNYQWLEDYEAYGYVPLESVSFCAGQTL